MSEASPPAPASPPKRNRLWIGYFAFLIVASIGVTIFMIWFNLRIQLKPEQIQAARKLWEEKGPKNYNMIYTRKLGVTDVSEQFKVKVRKGSVIEVKTPDEPLKRPEDAPAEEDPRRLHGMDALLAEMAANMERDRQPEANKVYVVANFDPATGAILRYIRYDMRTKERVELNIQPLEVVDQ